MPMWIIPVDKGGLSKWIVLINENDMNQFILMIIIDYESMLLE